MMTDKNLEILKFLGIGFGIGFLINALLQKNTNNYFVLQPQNELPKELVLKPTKAKNK